MSNSHDQAPIKVTNYRKNGEEFSPETLSYEATKAIIEAIGLKAFVYPQGKEAS